MQHFMKLKMQLRANKKSMPKAETVQIHSPKIFIVSDFALASATKKKCRRNYAFLSLFILAEWIWLTLYKMFMFSAWEF